MEKSIDYNDTLKDHGAIAILNDRENPSSEFNSPSPKELPKLTKTAKLLDLNIIPKAIRKYVENTAQCLNVPPEFILIPYLITIGILLGRKLAIRPKKYGSWFVIPNNWAMIIGVPSVKKSPSLKAVLKILKKDIQTERSNKKKLRTDLSDKINAITLQIEEKRSSSKKQASSKDSADRETLEKLSKEQRILQEELDNIFKQCEPKRVLVNDATPEALQEIVAKSEDGILIFRDELYGLFLSFSKKGQEGSREMLLTGWNGNENYTIDRIGRGTVHADNLCISILGSIQPGKLATLVNDASKNGLGADGLLQRFQYSVYPDKIDYVDSSNIKPDKQAEARVSEIISKLFVMEKGHLGKYDEQNDLHSIPFHSNAQGIFDSWLNSLELRLRSDKFDSEALEEHLGKYRSLVPELALIFQMIDDTDTNTQTSYVMKDNLDKAIAFADFLESHAQKIYSQVKDLRLIRAHKLAEKIIQNKIKDGMSIRDIYRHGWEYLNKPQYVENALTVLEEYHWVRVDDTKGTNGRPKRVIFINPQVQSGGF